MKFGLRAVSCVLGVLAGIHSLALFAQNSQTSRPVGAPPASNIAISQSGNQSDNSEEKRDGRWLREGLRYYKQYLDKDRSLSLPNMGRGTLVAGYVRGVLDLLHSYTVAGIVDEEQLVKWQNSHDPHPKFSADTIKGMQYGVDEYAPLWKTDFNKGQMQFDQTIQVILNYIDAHPERWDDGADLLVGESMVALFAPKSN